MKRSLTMILALWVCRFTPAQPAQPAVPDFVLGANAPAADHPWHGSPTVSSAPHLPAEQFLLPATMPDPARGAGKPYFVGGYVDPAPPDLPKSARWQPNDGGRWVYAMEMLSPNATALRVQLNGRFDNLQVRVYDPASGAAFGPYRPLSDEQGNWWTTLIFGPVIGLEFVVASQAAPPPELPRVSAIAYVYDTPGDTRGNCGQIDVCEAPGYADEADAVCLLSFIDGDGNLVGFCSGALLWRQPADYPPLVMTANHCIGDQTQAGNAVCIWGYQFPPGCDGPLPDPNTLLRSEGSLLLKRHTGTDWTLLGLYDPPGASHYLGWWTGFWDDGGAAVGIHHPHAGRKRISFGTKVDDGSYSSCDGNGENCFDFEGWEIDFDNGTTVGGSSGSPILDGNRLVRGTLTGGPIDGSCDIKHYGRFDLAYSHLRYFLGDTHIASPVHVHGSASGDPGNNGVSETGGAGSPFNTVYEATFAVRSSDIVRIYPNNYNEQFRLWRPMRLERWGDDGVVRIGD